LKSRPRSLSFLLLLIVAIAVALHAAPALAQVRMMVGARNMGMGGTGVGSADDALAVHYNPAGMAFSQGWEFQFPLVSADAEVEGETLGNIDDLRSLFDESTLVEIQERLDRGDASLEDLVTALDAFIGELPDLATIDDGAAARAAVGPSYRRNHWGVSLFASSTGGLDALVDLSTGLSLSRGGIATAIPDPVEPGACGGDPACLAYADELAQQTGIDAPRAEVLVLAAGDNIDEDPNALGILTDIVNATLPGNPTLVENRSAVTTTGLVIAQAAFSWSRLIHQEKLSFGFNAR
jgi:hypothetical protein